MLTESEICKFYMTFFVNQNIIRFEISMNEIHFVYRFNTQNSLRNVEPRFVFGQNIFFHEQGHEITSWQKVHDQIQVLIILKTELQVYDPLVPGFYQNFSFGLNMIHLIFINHLCFLHPFHSYNFT